MRLTVWAIGEFWTLLNKLKLLVDECVARPLLDELRRRFRDVVSVSETAPRTSDVDILAWALRERRVVVTDDYDFGELIYRGGATAQGIVIIAPGAIGFNVLEDAASVAERIEKLGDQMVGKLTIIERNRTRHRPL